MRRALPFFLLLGCQNLLDVDCNPRLADDGGTDGGGNDAIDASSDANDGAACPEAGGCELFQSQPGPQFIVVVGDRLVYTLYAAGGSSKQLWSMPKAGGTPALIANDLRCDDLIPHDDFVVALENTGVTRIRPDGSGRRTLANGIDLHAAAATGSFVYWSAKNVGVQRLDVLDGSTPSLVVVTGPGSPAIFTDDHLYFGDKVDGGWRLHQSTLDGTDGGELYDFGGDPYTFQKAGVTVGDTLYVSVQQGTKKGIYRFVNGVPTDTKANMLTPGRLEWRAPYLYATDYGTLGANESGGGLSRYDPAKNAWTFMAAINRPRGLAVDDAYVYVVESIPPTDDFRNRILRFPR